LTQNLLYLVDMSSVELNETNDVTSSWIHALPIGEYSHPIYGKMSLTLDRIKRFADGVKNKIRGIDPSINYNHDNKDVASGWVKDAEARDTGLWLFVEWTKNAVQKIKDKEYKYFSAEFADKWKDPTDKEHTDVLMGGGLTNRPYMKNLVPINLSEDTINFAVGLAEAIQRAKDAGEEDDVKLAELNKALGLSENATEADALKRVTELAKIAGAPVTVDFSTELKGLAEENPLVRGMLQAFEDQTKTLSDLQVGLREADIAKRLNEFDNSKLVLTPVVKDKVHDFLVDAPVELHDRFWDILKGFKDNSGLLVELGERAGAGVKYGRSKDSVALFMDESSRYAAENKVSLDDAMVAVSRQQPELWNAYRNGTYAFKE
jgi:hypothetical protein